MSNEEPPKRATERFADPTKTILFVLMALAIVSWCAYLTYVGATLAEELSRSREEFLEGLGCQTDDPDNDSRTTFKSVNFAADQLLDRTRRSPGNRARRPKVGV